MINLSLRGALLVAVSAISLSACGSDNTSNLQTQLDTANATITKKDGDISAKAAEIQTLKSQVTAKDATITEKDGKIAELNGQITTLNGTIATLEAAVTAKDAQIAKLNGDVTAEKAKVTALEAEKAALQADKTALQTKVAGLEADKAALIAERDALVTERDGLKDDLAAQELAYKNFSNDAYNARQDKTAYVKKLTTGADDVTAAEGAVAQAESDLATRKAIAADAQTALDDGLASAPNPTYVGQTLATWLANNQQKEAAERYAKLLGWDPTKDADQNKVIATADYDAVIANLTAVRDAADQDVITANQVLAGANTALDTTKANYAAGYGGIKHGDPLTLYSADGDAIRANGVAVYRNSIDGANKGDQVPVVARITSLFLLDSNGDPVEALVFDATSDLSYQLPVGAASFTSDTMVAFFAQQEGTGAYVLKSSDSAGSLTLNFNDLSGHLSVIGLQNGQNMDYAISANLTFDPQTGAFSGKGTPVQAYTSSNGAETANALITGNLHGVAEAFTASITATDTIVGNIPVKIMTEIAGTGKVAQ